MRDLLPLLLLASAFVLNGCASYSHTVITKPHGEVSTKLQQHLTSGPRGVSDGIYGLEQTLNAKVARFQFSETQRKTGGIETDLFALPLDGGKTRILVRTVEIKPKVPLPWSETTRKPDLEARWLDRIKELFSSEAR